MSKYFALVLLLLLLSVTGCGTIGGGDKQKVNIEPGKTDACQLLTKSDAEKILGQTIDFAVSPNPVTRKNIRIVQCNYAAQQIAKNLAVTLYEGLPADTRAVIQAIRDRSATTNEMSEITGLADEAVWSSRTGLFVRKGDVVFGIVADVGGDPDLEMSKAAAQSVLSRLP